MQIYENKFQFNNAYIEPLKKMRIQLIEDLIPIAKGEGYVKNYFQAAKHTEIIRVCNMIEKITDLIEEIERI